MGGEIILDYPGFFWGKEGDKSWERDVKMEAEVRVMWLLA